MLGILLSAALQQACCARSGGSTIIWGVQNNVCNLMQSVLHWRRIKFGSFVQLT